MPSQQTIDRLRHPDSHEAYRCARRSIRRSRSASGRAPTFTSRSPLAAWNTHAGWPGTPNPAKIEPSGSRTLVNVRPWRSMKSLISSCVPFQPMPTIWTFPAHFLLTASTEGASALQVPQYGAQNQKATADPTYFDPRSDVVTAVVVSLAAAEADVVTPTAATGVAGSAESCAHATRPSDPVTNNRKRGVRFTTRDVVAGSR